MACEALIKKQNWVVLAATVDVCLEACGHGQTVRRERLQAELLKHATLLRTTYVSSSAEGQGSEMDVKEFWRLIKQCKIDDKHVNTNVLDAIFVQVNKEEGMHWTWNPDI